jgi:hypothetical protein
MLFGVLSTNLTIAQDLITKTNGEDIKAKVLEVTTTEIKFKKTEMADSPIYSVLKTDVLIIRYENGTKDVFNNQSQTTSSPPKEKKKEIEEPKPTQKKDVVQGKKISFGVKGGLNYSNLSGEYNKPILGFHLGGFVEYKFNGSISLQPELQFSAQGYKLENEIRQNFDDPVSTVSYKITLNYINLPILVKFNINKVVNLFAGPQVGFLAYAKNDDGKDILDNFNTIDFGVNFGGGLTLNKIIIDLRYNLGLSEVQKQAFPNTSNTNSVFQLSVGYKF